MILQVILISYTYTIATGAFVVYFAMLGNRDLYSFGVCQCKF